MNRIHLRVNDQPIGSAFALPAELLEHPSGSRPVMKPESELDLQLHRHEGSTIMQRSARRAFTLYQLLVLLALLVLLDLLVE